MLNRKNLLYSFCFWGILLAALTAESWMDIFCQLIF